MAATANVVVRFSGAVNATFVANAFCQLTPAGVCGRLSVLSLAYENQETTCVLRISDGTPSPESIQNDLTSLQQNKLNAQNILSVSLPPPPPPTADREKELIYTATASFVGGVLLSIATWFCCFRKRRTASERDQPQQAAVNGSTSREVNAEKPPVHTWKDTTLTERLIDRIKQLEEDTQHLLTLNNMERKGLTDSVPFQATSADEITHCIEEAAQELSLKKSASTNGGILSVPSTGEGAVVVNGGATTRDLNRSNADPRHWCQTSSFPTLPPNIACSVNIARSKIHGMGIFATKFLSAELLLFQYLNPAYTNDATHRYSNEDMRLQFGAGWQNRIHFVVTHPDKTFHCVAEDPKFRGWGCLINSCRGTGLLPNCQIVWSAGGVPWVQTTVPIPPLAELLLEYDVGLSKLS